MARFPLLVFAVLLLSGFALAQSSTRFEIFGGYSRLNDDFTGVTGSGLNGWNASVTFKSGSWFGIVADSSGFHASASCSPCSSKPYTFLFGPQVSAPFHGARPFARFLIGDSYASSSGFPFLTSANSFTYAVGGGLDYMLTGQIGLRGQGDFLFNKFRTNDNQLQYRIDQTPVRISTGVVFRF